VLPSEFVVCHAMRNTFAEFLTAEPDGGILSKFIKERRVKNLTYDVMKC
jgi:hypothetical protein